MPPAPKSQARRSCLCAAANRFRPQSPAPTAASRSSPEIGAAITSSSQRPASDSLRHRVSMRVNWTTSNGTLCLNPRGRANPSSSRRTEFRHRSPRRVRPHLCSVLRSCGISDLVSSLRLMPGTSVAQVGQMGAQASLFLRGGDSDSNKILIDGVSAGDLGGRFDFGPLSTTLSSEPRSIADRTRVFMVRTPRAAWSA